MRTTVGWGVLALVFLDEVAAVAALWDVGSHGQPGWLWGPALAALALLAWNFFASPKAAHGGPVARPLVKCLVFGSASAGLVVVGHERLGLALLVFSVVVNAAAQLPLVRAVQE